MFVWEIIRVAIGALLANRIRALLTMLGVIIGVGAVITMMAVGEGAKKAVEEKIANWGLNRLSVEGGQRLVRGTSRYVQLTTEDANALREQMTLAESVVPENWQNYQIKYRNKNLDGFVIGTSPAFFDLNSRKLSHGRIFTDAEAEGRRLVVVLGAEAMRMLGGKPSMIGDFIRIRGISLEVIGILEKVGERTWPPFDQSVFIPITTAHYRVIGDEHLSELSVKIVSNDKIVAAAEEIERILRGRHKLLPYESNDFNIQNRIDIAQLQQAATQTFGALLASIAAISLVVGGIGIMNIMLVSVTERTREIGIRKALGARRSTILLQFVLEAITLCFLGGLLGIGGGYGMAHLMASNFGWSTIIKPHSVVLAVSVSLLVGLFFGIYPAVRASRLDPVEALRYE